MATAKAPSRAGELLADKYRLEERLAVGGMGEIYRATNIAVERPVALKLLRRELTHNEQVLKRFVREGRAANKVNHPNIVQVLDISHDGDQVFIVQDLLEGEDLSQLLKRSGRKLPADALLEIVIPVAEALGAAHDAGLVHRDLKPANIFLRGQGGRRIPMVLDFGIAKMTEPDPEGDTPLTQTGTSLGTPAYMSPEQIMSPKSVDARSDVWALGVLLYRAVSGKLPFNSDSPGGLMVSICTVAPTPLEEVCPGVPEALTEVVYGCLARDPDDRFTNGTAVARALKGVRELIHEEISGFQLKESEDSPAAPISANPSQPSRMRLPNLELDLPPPSQRPTPTPSSGARIRDRPKSLAPGDDDFGDAPTVLSRPSQPEATPAPMSGPISRPGGPASQPRISQPRISHPAPHSIRPAVSSRPGSLPPLSQRGGPRAPASSGAASGELRLKPLILAALVTLPALILGWGFHSSEGIGSLGLRIGGATMTILTAAVGAAAVRLYLAVRGSESRAAIPAMVGFAGTAGLSGMAGLAVMNGDAPAAWLSFPGTISAAVAIGGIALLGFLRGHELFTEKPSNMGAALTYAAMSLIAAGAAVRLVL